MTHVSSSSYMTHVSSSSYTVTALPPCPRVRPPASLFSSKSLSRFIFFFLLPITTTLLFTACSNYFFFLLPITTTLLFTAYNNYFFFLLPITTTLLPRFDRRLLFSPLRLSTPKLNPELNPRMRPLFSHLRLFLGTFAVWFSLVQFSLY